MSHSQGLSVQHTETEAGKGCINSMVEQEQHFSDCTTCLVHNQDMM